MRKSVIKTTLCLLVATALLLTFGVACNKPADVTVTVEGGSGSGTYAEGNKCTVTADVPAGYEFVGWTVYGVTVSESNPYTFDVDFDIEVKAVLAPLPKEKYTVKVNGGTIGENGASAMQLEEGTAVKIYAAASQARKFVKWTVNGTESTQNPYELTVKKDTEITAVFDEFCMISVSGGTVDGERSKVVPQGSEVTVTANEAAAGQTFDYWYTLDENFKEAVVATTPTHTLTLADSMKIYAKFVYTFNVNVVSGTIKDSQETAATVKDGTTVTVTSAAAPHGKAFIGWFSADQKVSLAEEFSFAVTENVTLEAKYGELRTVTLPTPTSENNTIYPTSGLIYRENGGAVAFDRLNSNGNLGVTMFADGSDYVAYKIYTSPDAEKTASVGEIKFVPNRYENGVKTESGYIATTDEKFKQTVKGQEGNYYIDYSEYGIFQNILKHALGYSYCTGQRYYFAAQVKSLADPVITMTDDFAIKYEDSGISAIGTNAFVEDASQPTAKYAIKVIGGTIGTELTEVTAGHGASVTVNTEMPEDETIEWVFMGWKEVTYDGDTEVPGATVSRSMSYTFAATKAVTLKAVFADKSDIKYHETPKPDNAQNKLIYKENGGSIALDRAATMFTAVTEYVVYYIYDAPDAAESVGSFKIRTDLNRPSDGGRAMVGWVENMDGSDSRNIVRGLAGNYYIDVSNVDSFYALLKNVLGGAYSSGHTYYFAAKVFVAADSDYLDSEISVVGDEGIAF